MTFALLLAAISTLAAPAELQIRSTTEPARVEVVAVIPADANRGNAADEKQNSPPLRFGLVDETTGEVGPTLFGEFRRPSHELIFTPRHRLIAGYLYRATLSQTGRETLTVDYRVPKEPPHEPAVVETVYPTAAELPANVLKFYIHFSRPMREGPAIFDRIHILDSDGEPVAQPWRLTELWSDDARRLTLYIHPGRIKSGVNLREEFGTVLKPGRKYTLVVTRNVLDAQGQALGTAFTKEFTTTVEDHERIDAAQWRIQPPAESSRESLVIESSKPLDRHLLTRCLHVIDSAGHRVGGQVKIADEERSWRFVPVASWTPGRYKLEVDPVLEDLAGNTPERVFDTDLRKAPPASPQLTREFQPSP